MCGKGFRDWIHEDEPWVEHAYFAPECNYVREKKGQDFITRVQEAVRQQKKVNQFLMIFISFVS